jgi:hypothetical protein
MAQSGRHPPPHREAEPAEETEAERAERARAEEEETRRQAEEATAHLPKQGEPLRPPLDPREVAPDEPTVPMMFPEGGVTLTLPGYRMVYFPGGLQDVPVSMAGEPYLIESGATPTARH